jgi:hypothetical protein
MGLKVHNRQLQQLDCLLQLRRHGQLLTKSELQAGFQHCQIVVAAPGCGAKPAIVSILKAKILAEIHFSNCPIFNDFFGTT